MITKEQKKAVAQFTSRAFSLVAFCMDAHNGIETERMLHGVMATKELERVCSSCSFRSISGHLFWKRSHTCLDVTFVNETKKAGDGFYDLVILRQVISERLLKTETFGEIIWRIAKAFEFLPCKLAEDDVDWLGVCYDINRIERGKGRGVFEWGPAAKNLAAFLDISLPQFDDSLAAFCCDVFYVSESRHRKGMLPDATGISSCS